MILPAPPQRIRIRNRPGKNQSLQFEMMFQGKRGLINRVMSHPEACQQKLRPVHHLDESRLGQIMTRDQLKKWYLYHQIIDPPDQIRNGHLGREFYQLRRSVQVIGDRKKL